MLSDTKKLLNPIWRIKYRKSYQLYGSGYNTVDKLFNTYGQITIFIVPRKM